MNHLSLFTGIGGLDLAAEWAGFESAGQVEIDDYCNKVLQKHWPNVPRWRDIYQLTGEEVKERCGSISLLSGGFPCQPFSCAGKRKGTEDERYLWDELLRIICEVRPKWFVGENVRGLLSIDSGRTFGTVLSDLAKNGYRVGWLCYGAGDVGAPHRRERVFIVAHSGSRGFSEQDICDQQQGGTKTVSASKGAGLLAYTDNSGSGENIEPAELWAGGVKQSSCNSRKTAKGKDEKGQVGAIGQMAHTGSMGRSTGATITGKIRQEVGRAELNIGDTEQHETQADRSTQSAMGGMSSRFPAKLDGNNWPTPVKEDWRRRGPGSRQQGLPEIIYDMYNKWPAGPGEQHEWEPPRIATGIKDRVARLKALGNSVVPQQAYPIFKAIAEVADDTQS